MQKLIITILITLIIHSIIYSQENNFNLTKYSNDPTYKGTTLFDNLFYSSEQLKSIEKLVNINENKQYSFESLIKNIILKSENQSLELTNNNINHINFIERTEIENNDEVDYIREKYKISNHDINSLLNLFQKYSSYGDYILKNKLKPIITYLNGLNPCLNYTYFEVFNDFTGYKNLYDLKNSENYYGLNKLQICHKLEKLNKIECEKDNLLVKNEDIIFTLFEKNNDLIISINSKINTSNFKAQIFSQNGTYINNIDIYELKIGDNQAKINMASNKSIIIKYSINNNSIFSQTIINNF